MKKTNENSTGNGYSIGYTYATRNTNTTGAHTHNIADSNSVGLSVSTGSGGDNQSYYGFIDSYTSVLTTFSAISNGNHYHTVSDYYANTITGVEAHTHPFTGNYTNSSPQSINIQNPYTAVYMYKRTA